MSIDSPGSEFLRCNVLDELEAAMTLNENVRVTLKSNEHKMGTPVDIKIQGNEEYLLMKDHNPIPIGEIVRVERVTRILRRVA